MVYTLGALIVVVVMAAIALRLDPRGRHSVWVGSLLVSVAGFVVLLAAVVTGNLGLFYLSAVALVIGLPLSVFLIVAIYRDRQTDLY